MNYLGIDVSKSTSRYVFLDDNGEKLTKAFTLQNSQQHFQDLLSRLKKLDLNAENLLVGIEATGIWWENRYTFLTENKFKVIVLNPHQTNKYREAYVKKLRRTILMLMSSPGFFVPMTLPPILSPKNLSRSFER